MADKGNFTFRAARNGQQTSVKTHGCHFCWLTAPIIVTRKSLQSHWPALMWSVACQIFKPAAITLGSYPIVMFYICGHVPSPVSFAREEGCGDWWGHQRAPISYSGLDRVLLWMCSTALSYLGWKTFFILFKTNNTFSPHRRVTTLACGLKRRVRMESTEDNSASNSEGKSNVTMSAAQRRAEIRRRKLLKNSEDRLHRIVGYSKNDGENSRKLKPFWTCLCLVSG